MTPFRSFLHHCIFDNWLPMLMQRTPTNCVSIALRWATDVAWPVVLWLVVLAHNLSVHRAPRKPNLSPRTLPRKSPNGCVSFFMNWDTLRLSLLLVLESVKMMTMRSTLSITTAQPILLVMSKSDVLHCSFGELWTTSSWFIFLEAWIQWMCSPKPQVGLSTIGMHPISWVTMTMLAGKLCVLALLPASALSPPRQEVERESDLVAHQHVWLKCLAQFKWAESEPRVSQEWAESEPRREPRSEPRSEPSSEPSGEPSVWAQGEPARFKFSCDSNAFALKCFTLGESHSFTWLTAGLTLALGSLLGSIQVSREWAENEPRVSPEWAQQWAQLVSRTSMCATKAGSRATSRTFDFLFDFLWQFCVAFWTFFAGPFFPALMCTAVLHQGRVSAGHLCDLQWGLMHVSSQTAVYGWSMIMGNTTALRWSHEDCSTRAHSFDASASNHTQSDQIGLHCITPH